MIAEELDREMPVHFALSSRVKHYFQLLKFRLSFTVAFSSAIGYMLGNRDFNWYEPLLVMLGGLLVTGSANIINQILEKDLDKLMKRTAKRPLPTGALSITEAAVFGSIIGIAGLSILALYFNL